jgi:MoCo/4Fe-4S cofactor protein with predicted Tat translocation signal
VSPLNLDMAHNQPSSTTSGQLTQAKQSLVQIRSRRAEEQERIERYHLLRDKLAAANKKRGREYWQSLEELADTPEFREYVEKEFPEQSTEWNDPVGRRTFLKLMGASLALAGVSACAYQPREAIVPFVRQHEEYVPGKPLFYATATSLGGNVTGLLVRSNEGRPTKIEGNPQHPASLGATDAYTQASLLTMYDPDRTQRILYLGQPSTWGEFLVSARTALEGQRGNGGAGLRILTETVTSPTLAAQIRALLREFPNARWRQYEAAGSGGGATQGAIQAFGRPVNTVYQIDRARRILSLDADFLTRGAGSLRYARQWTANRRVEAGQREMNRLYMLECTPTPTGAKADHRLAVSPRRLEEMARLIAARLGVAGATSSMQLTADETRFVDAMVRDLQTNRGASVCVVGDEQPASVHALGHAINNALGAIGNTVVYTETFEDALNRARTTATATASPAQNAQATPSPQPQQNQQTNQTAQQPPVPNAQPTAQPSPTNAQSGASANANVNQMSQLDGLRELVTEMNAGAVDMVLILGGNPVYTAPADLNFGEALRRVSERGFTAHLSLFNDETSWLSQWNLPEAHYLEAWSDARAFDGTVSIIQPLIEPLYGGKSAHELIGSLSSGPNTPPADRRGYDIVREFWQAQTAGGDFETAWRRALHEGVVPGTQYQTINVTPSATLPAAAPTVAANENELEIVFRLDPSVYDGRFTNNGWLQELPKPLTKITWDNVAMLSPRTAERLGVRNEPGWTGGNQNTDVVELRYENRSVRAPVWILPGHPDNCVTVHLGYGRERAGRVGNNIGFNANAIRTSANPWHGAGVRVERTGERAMVASTQIHFLTEDREPVRVATLAQFLEDPEHAYAGHHHDPPADMSMYPQYDYRDENLPAWGMAVDIEACVGCNACVMACQSENNIPVVGKEQVARSREMHWLRIDTYYKGEAAQPEGPYFQPMMCVHCELAPCEPVCPVAATVHDAEGLNVMIYNRCIGTRYCSNNCPYKVRRFNYHLYQDFETEQYMMMRNPEVTVRSRGVMEKCTYCIQRIQWTKIEASKDNRQIQDGEVQTACQTVCPADAIVFGDVHDQNSRVSRLKASGRNFSLLGELNTRPRTTYLGALRNPNEEITPRAVQDRQGHESPNTPAQPHADRHSEGTH